MMEVSFGTPYGALPKLPGGLGNTFCGSVPCHGLKPDQMQQSLCGGHVQARAMVLSSLAPAERTELLRGMSDEEAAICLAAMSLSTRTAVIADLAAADASLVACALACVW